MEKYINAQLLILVPFLNFIGFELKRCLVTERPNRVQTWFKHCVNSTGNIPFALWVIAVIVSSLISLITTKGYTGW